MNKGQLIIDNRILAELARRLNTTATMNFCLWIFVAIFGKFFFVAPILTGIATLMFAAYAYFRIAYTIPIINAKENLSEKGIAHGFFILRVFSIFSTGFWGITAAYVFSNPSFADSREITIAVLAFVAGTVISSLSIDRFAGRWCGAAIFFPITLALIVRGLIDWHLSLQEVAIVIISFVGSLFLLRHNREVADVFEEYQVSRLQAETTAQKMRDISSIDALTRISNRMYFDNFLQQAWVRAKKKRTQLTIFIIDLDHFKSVNDNYGHLFGDECLQEVAAKLKDQQRDDHDCLARFGGEEFVLLIENTEFVDVTAIANRLLKSIRSIKISCNGDTIKLTCSIGLASAYPYEVDSFTQILSMADKALYRAKRNGRDRVSYADKSDASNMFSLIDRSLNSIDGVPTIKSDSE